MATEGGTDPRVCIDAAIGHLCEAREALARIPDDVIPIEVLHKLALARQLVDSAESDIGTLAWGNRGDQRFRALLLRARRIPRSLGQMQRDLARIERLGRDE